MPKEFLRPDESSGIEHQRLVNYYSKQNLQQKLSKTVSNPAVQQFKAFLSSQTVKRVLEGVNS